MAKWATGKPPTQAGRYLVTIDGHCGRQVRQADRYFAHYKQWAWSVLPDGGGADIIAWQKCPKVYDGTIIKENK